MTRTKIAREIEHELQQLEKVAQTASRLAAVPADQRRPWDSAAASKYISDVFLGLENLCKCRLRWLGEAIPDGPQSHTEILESFLAADGLGRGLSADMQLRLKKYLRFRHRFFHGYGFEVSWEIAEEPLMLLSETVEILARTWRQWLAELTDDFS